MAYPRIIKKHLSTTESDKHIQVGDDLLARAFAQEDQNVPLVECTKSGDVIQHIDVTCTCGQVTRIVCEYSPTE